MKGVLPTSERIYRAVKAELLEASFTPGERIEAVELTRRHMASLTPIRAALHRLAGEGLVDARAGEGFHAPLVTEVSLRDLYAWNGHVILLALQLSPQGAAQAAGTEPAADTQVKDIPGATASLFATIGGQSGNEHCAAAILQLNDRLHPARRLEGGLIKDFEQELEDLIDKLGDHHATDIRSTIASYHRRRVRLSAELVRLMHRRTA